MTNNPHQNLEQTLASLAPTALPDYLQARLAASLDNKLTLPERLLAFSLSLAAAALLFITISLTLSLLNTPPLATPTPTNTPTAYAASPADLQQLLAAR